MITISNQNGQATAIDPSTCTVVELVRLDYRTAEVFRRNGIDFCCGGKKPILDAIASKNIDTDTVLTALAKLGDAPSSDPDVTNWPLSLLVRYIESIHHSYVISTLPSLLFYSDRVANAHGRSDARLLEVNRLCLALNEAMTEHMRAEEEVVFPMILESISKGNMSTTDMDLILKMEAEHDDVGSIMATLRSLTDDYTPPAEACNSYRVLFATLAHFEKDLHRHVFLENHVLFPKWQQQMELTS